MAGFGGIVYGLLETRPLLMWLFARVFVQAIFARRLLRRWSLPIPSPKCKAEQNNGTIAEPIPVECVKDIYIILHDRFPGFSLQMQSLLYDNQGRKVDRMSILSADGVEHDVYFFNNTTFD